MISTKLLVFGIYIASVLLPSAIIRVNATSADDEDSKEKTSPVISSSSNPKGKNPNNHHIIQNIGSIRGDGDTTVPTSSRFTSSRAYVDDRKRDGYRYYGTGSKSGNSFLPTNIQKSTSSLDSHNYFITTKSNLKDMDTAGSGISNGAEGNNYLTVYESPALMNSQGGAGSSLMGMEDQFGDMAAETGHGGGYVGHGGGGYGGGGGKGCNSALGLLGVLGLAAYLQNVLRNMQNVTAGRRRRDVSFDASDSETKLQTVREGMAQLDLDGELLPLNETGYGMKLDEKTHEKVMHDVFSLLSAVAHARDGLIPIHCTHSSVCLANQILVKDLGYLGHNIGIRITSAIAKLLNRITKDERAEQIRMISKAGKMGRNKRNCLKLFPTCHRLRKLPTYNIPSVIGNNHRFSPDGE